MAERFRQAIKEYIKVKDKLEAAGNRFLDERGNIYTVANKYGVMPGLLLLKVLILCHKRNYINKKLKFKKALNLYLNEIKDTMKTAKQYGIYQDDRDIELKYCKHINEPHPDDTEASIIIGFTFYEEKLLLKLLKERAEAKKLYLPLYIFELLAGLAYEFAKRQNKCIPEDWMISEKATYKWLQDFEMRNTEELSIICLVLQQQFSSS